MESSHKCGYKDCGADAKYELEFRHRYSSADFARWDQNRKHREKYIPIHSCGNLNHVVELVLTEMKRDCVKHIDGIKNLETNQYDATYASQINTLVHKMSGKRLAGL